MRRVKQGLIAAAAVAWMAGAPGLANAATNAQKNDAILSGLEYLAQNQNGDGSWGVYTPFDTGAALLAFEEKGFKAGTDVVLGSIPTNYGDVVGRGLTYLLNTAGTPNQGGGLTWYNSCCEPDTYYMGGVAPALAKADLTKMVNSFSGFNGNAAVAGMTIGQVLQGVVNHAAYGQNNTQNDAGNWWEGGWSYASDKYQNRSDNSNSQWPTLALIYGENAGVTPNGPISAATVKAELKKWIANIQNSDGGSAYVYKNSDGWGSNMSRTGALLVEAYYAGLTKNDPEVKAALAWINANWNQGPDGGWNGNFGLPYAMWAAYKGLQSEIGTTDTSTITNLAGCGSLDATQTCNWWEDYNNFLVSKQDSVSHAWDGVCYAECINTVEYTSWSLGILQATEVNPKPPCVGIECPEPASLSLMGAGVVGLGLLRRRRQNA